MENLVFPDENKKIENKIKNKIDENVWIDEHFSYFDWNSAKKLQMVFFIYTGKIVKKAFSFWSGTQKQMHISKKAQRKNLVRAIY